MVLRSLRRLVKSLLKTATTSGDVREDLPLPVVQVRYRGKTGDAISWEPWGVHARVPKGEQTLLFGISGVPEARVLLATSGDRRPTDLAVGELAVYHPPTGAEVRFKSDGSIEISAAGGPVVVTADTIQFDAQTIEAALGATLGVVLDSFLTKYDTHTHVAPGGGGATSTPTPVSAPSDATTNLKGS